MLTHHTAPRVDEPPPILARAGTDDAVDGRHSPEHRPPGGKRSASSSGRRLSMGRDPSLRDVQAPRCRGKPARARGIVAHQAADRLAKPGGCTAGRGARSVAAPKRADRALRAPVRDDDASPRASTAAMSCVVQMHRRHALTQVPVCRGRCCVGATQRRRGMKELPEVSESAQERRPGARRSRPACSGSPCGAFRARRRVCVHAAGHCAERSIDAPPRSESDGAALEHRVCGGKSMPNMRPRTPPLALELSPCTIPLLAAQHEGP
jgi:hypothetical protein